jgi:hypothetical protein
MVRLTRKSDAARVWMLFGVEHGGWESEEVPLKPEHQPRLPPLFLFPPNQSPTFPASTMNATLYNEETTKSASHQQLQRCRHLPR